MVGSEDYRTTHEPPVGDLAHHAVRARPPRPEVEEGDGEVPLAAAVQDRHRLGRGAPSAPDLSPRHFVPLRIRDPQIGEARQRVFEERPVGLDEDRLVAGGCDQWPHVTEVGAVDLGRSGRLDAACERHEKGNGEDDASHRVTSSASLPTPT
jgi:hypothetical protein